jgi:hypothetical protein
MRKLLAVVACFVLAAAIPPATQAASWNGPIRLPWCNLLLAPSRRPKKPLGYIDNCSTLSGVEWRKIG